MSKNAIKKLNFLVNIIFFSLYTINKYRKNAKNTENSSMYKNIMKFLKLSKKLEKYSIKCYNKKCVWK